MISELVDFAVITTDRARADKEDVFAAIVAIMPAGLMNSYDHDSTATDCYYGFSPDHVLSLWTGDKTTVRCGYSDTRTITYFPCTAFWRAVGYLVVTMLGGELIMNPGRTGKPDFVVYLPPECFRLHIGRGRVLDYELIHRFAVGDYPWLTKAPVAPVRRNRVVKRIRRELNHGNDLH